mmetsp:Transcript_12616/g.9147  ORF Transcript_12616/g.9147 Transcript_12616/m.9147 type:complete len:80 (+) Transcript_12616:93-332(+)
MYIAKKELKKIKMEKLKTIFSTERSRSESFLKGDAYRANLNVKPFVLTDEEILQVINEDVPRIYIDQFIDLEDGKKYKG